jgi:two-component system, cell cycle sensor histidine kinase and response regulator CckA
VEDEDIVRAMATRILERNGYCVIAARHGADAMRAWREHGPAIDAVVTDLRMPLMDGLALSAALRAERPELPIVIVSGYAGGSGVDVVMADDRHLFLEKPFTADSLLAHVRAALDGAGAP